MKAANPDTQVLSLDEAVAWRHRAAAQGQRVVLTNGCFDLLHRGHISYLHDSAREGDLLLVAVNSDASVRALKGEGRPIHSERDRAYAIAALRCVDAVLIFEGPRLDREIAAIQPDVYTKAGDYTLDTLDPGERAALEAAGTRICLMPFVPGHSTTHLIERAAQR